MGPLPGCQGKVKVNAKLVCGRTRKISKIQGPSMPKKRSDPGTSGVMELLEARVFAAAPTVHLLLLMAQEHPIFDLQFFFKRKKHSEKHG